MSTMSVVSSSWPRYGANVPASLSPTMRMRAGSAAVGGPVRSTTGGAAEAATVVTAAAASTAVVTGAAARVVDVWLSASLPVSELTSTSTPTVIAASTASTPT